MGPILSSPWQCDALKLLSAVCVCVCSFVWVFVNSSLEYLVCLLPIKYNFHERFITVTESSLAIGVNNNNNIQNKTALLKLFDYPNKP